MKYYISVLAFIIPSLAYSNEFMACSHYDQDNQHVSRLDECFKYQSGRRWGSNHSDGMTLTYLINSAQFNEHGYSYLKSEVGTFYFNKKGTMRMTYTHPDPFIEGLARTVKDGVVGFINTDLILVSDRIYKYAYPYNDGKSIVCNAYPIVSKGTRCEDDNLRWGAIDKNGKQVIAMQYTLSDVREMLNKGSHAD